MDYTIKQLAPSDLDLMRQLNKVFGEAFQDIPTYQNAIPSDDYLKSLLGKDTFIVIVALDGDKVVGGLAAYVLENLNKSERKFIFTIWQ